MVEQFVGTWTLASSENFDEYMKAIGKIVFNTNIRSDLRLTALATC